MQRPILLAVWAAAAQAQTAPDWLRNADMVTNWPRAEETVDARRLAGIPLLINVTEKAWADDAHRKGFRAVIYASCMDTFIDRMGADSQKMVTGRMPFTHESSNALLVDADGRFVDTLMDGTYRLHRKMICANSATYQEVMTAHLRSLMERGMDGIFVDNTSPRRIECYGDGMRIGFSRKYGTVLAESPKSKFKDPHLEDVPVHRHVYPGQGQTYALRELLKKVRGMVKGFGADKIMLINGGLELADTADGTMIESYVCSWAWKGRRQSWPELKQVAARYAPYVQAGGAVIALSYLGETTTTVKDDAYFCFSAARLSDFIWSDYQTLGAGPATSLYRAHLGASVTPMTSVASDVDYRWFRKGLIVMNGTTRSVTSRIPASGTTTLVDLYEQREVSVTGDALEITVPAQSGRVYVRK